MNWIDIEWLFIYTVRTWPRVRQWNVTLTPLGRPAVNWIMCPTTLALDEFTKATMPAYCYAINLRLSLFGTAMLNDWGLVWAGYRLLCHGVKCLVLAYWLLLTCRYNPSEHCKNFYLCKTWWAYKRVLKIPSLLPPVQAALGFVPLRRQKDLGPHAFLGVLRCKVLI